MALYSSREDFLKANPKATAFAALEAATKQQNRMTPDPMPFTKDRRKTLKDKKVVIIGSGVGGLTAAYELLAQNTGMKVTVLEALNRTGGRCLSLRTGDTLREDKNSKLFDSEPKEDAQVVRFKRPTGDAEPYLNAGPGRIPSSHKRLLSYLKKFQVELEVYVMNSESNLVQKDSSFDGKPMVYRRLDHNTRGWLAQMIHQNADYLLEKQKKKGDSAEDLEQRAKNLRNLMVSFGELTEKGKYVVTPGPDGFEDGKTRAGYTVLPGVDAGEVAKQISLDDLLDSQFWKDTKFYQPVDFLWQPTLFQPVGGMDQVQHAFAQEVAALGGDIHLNSPVESIKWNAKEEKYIIKVQLVGTTKLKTYEADYCICNMAMPFLKNILSKDLMKVSGGFEADFIEALNAVYTAQFNPTAAPGYKEREDKYVPHFLACTTKVGWQADRSLWQGSEINKKVKQSEVGVVPIFGGISWTDDEIQQIWYPSSAYQDEKGVLTGAYNFDKVAHEWGQCSVDERLTKARKGAKKFGKKFGNGLDDGLAIAWQNMPHIKGGWAYWQSVGHANYATKQFNAIAQGTGICTSDEQDPAPNFFIVGDQISSLPGWQEGAIASAINAVTLIAEPKAEIAHLTSLPDTRLMVEGV